MDSSVLDIAGKANRGRQEMLEPKVWALGQPAPSLDADVVSKMDSRVLALLHNPLPPPSLAPHTAGCSGRPTNTIACIYFQTTKSWTIRIPSPFNNVFMCYAVIFRWFWLIKISCTRDLEHLWLPVFQCQCTTVYPPSKQTCYVTLKISKCD